MIRVFKFRANDLNPTAGKQIEFNSEVVSSFFQFSQDEVYIDITYKSFGSTDSSLNGQRFNNHLKLSPARGDYKIYGNTDGSLNMKTFFLNKLNLTSDNIGDYFALVKNNSTQYDLYYIPKTTDMSNLYSVIKGHNIESIPTSEKLGIPESPLNHIQKIYFGAPGTGKSHTIKNDVLQDVDCIFRTTFHPDSDYSSFVGCYKPITHNGRVVRTDYTIDDLASMLKQNYAIAAGKVTALHSFALEYADYFNGKIAAFSKKDLVLKAGLSEDYKVEVNKIVNLNQWMVDNDYLSTTSTISYEFSPEVFTNAYVEAWNNPTKSICLIIEEINRGNCAQIFGDIFQLLDRENGVSEYAIKADAALCQYLQHTLRGDGLKGIKDGKLKLPSNLSILATMNTSDQSLFPMDSAFKRRWEWEFIPINSSEVSYAKIMVDDKEYSWSRFIDKVNEKIMNTCKSEDKQLGSFFIKVSKDKPEIDWKLFRSKVMSFLWFDVYKDLYESDENTVFRYYKDDKKEESVEFSFGKLFYGEEKDQIALLKEFMEYINED